MPPAPGRSLSPARVDDPNCSIWNVVTTDGIQSTIDSAGLGDTVLVPDNRIHTKPATTGKPITLTGAGLSSAVVYST